MKSNRILEILEQVLVYVKQLAQEKSNFTEPSDSASVAIQDAERAVRLYNEAVNKGKATHTLNLNPAGLRQMQVSDIDDTVRNTEEHASDSDIHSKEQDRVSKIEKFCSVISAHIKQLEVFYEDMESCGLTRETALAFLQQENKQKNFVNTATVLELTPLPKVKSIDNLALGFDVHSKTNVKQGDVATKILKNIKELSQLASENPLIAATFLPKSCLKDLDTAKEKSFASSVSSKVDCESKCAETTVIDKKD